MKKVLLTSTALVAFSGAAFAEIAITGSAEMGVAGGQFERKFADGTDDQSVTVPVQFFQDVDVTFSMSGETDGGLAFGVAVDLDEAGNLGRSFSNQGVAVFISGDFGTLTMGDTDGALDFVIVDMGVGNPGSINDAETEHFGYLGSWLDGSGDGQIVRYNYSFDAFTFALSVEQHAYANQDDEDPNDGTVFLRPKNPLGLVTDGDDDLTWAVGVGYAFEFGGGSVDLGLGYQYSDNGSVVLTGDNERNNFELRIGSGEVGATAVGAALEMDNGLSAAITYTNFDFEDFDDTTHVGVGVGYSFDAFAVAANYGQYDNKNADIRGYGLSAGYDLGGGASLLAGYGASDTNAKDSRAEFQESTYSLGLKFAF